MFLRTIFQKVKLFFQSNEQLTFATFIIGIAILGIAAQIGLFSPTGPTPEGVNVEDVSAGYCLSGANYSGDTTTVSITKIRNAGDFYKGIVDIDFERNQPSEVNTGAAIMYEIGLTGGTIIDSGAMTEGGQPEIYVATISSLEADQYYVNVFYENEDGNSCQTDDPNQTQPSNPFTIEPATCDYSAQVLVESVSHISAPGETDGEVTVSFSGSDLSGYVLCGPDNLNNCGPQQQGSGSNVFTGLGAGEYNVFAAYQGQGPLDTCNTPTQEPIFTIEQQCNDTAVVDVSNIQNASGPTENDGALTASLSGDTASTFNGYTICPDDGTGNPNTGGNFANCILYTGSNYNGSADILTGIFSGTGYISAQYNVTGNPDQCNTATDGGGYTQFFIPTALQCNDTATVEVNDIKNETEPGAGNGSIEASLSGDVANPFTSYTICADNGSGSADLTNCTIYTGSFNGSGNTIGGLTGTTQQRHISAQYNLGGGAVSCNTNGDGAGFTSFSLTTNPASCEDVNIAYTNLVSESAPGANDGEVTLIANGQNVPATLTYILDGPTSMQFTGGSTETVTGLAPGSYTASLEFDDSVGGTGNCSSINTASFTVNPSSTGGSCPEVTISADSTVDETTAGANDGSVDLSLSGAGGVTDIVYMLTGQMSLSESGGTTISINNLEPGTYDASATFDDGTGQTCTTNNTENFSINAGGGTGGGVCGDGNVDTGEECDDGNTQDGDGCSSTCQIEPTGGSCPDTAFDLQVTDEQTCGASDGVVDATLLNGSGSAIQQTVTYTLVALDGSGSSLSSNPGVSNTSGYFDQLSPGQYRLGAFFDEGSETCSADSVVITIQPNTNCGGTCDDADLTVDTNHETTCNAEDGTIRIMANSGSGVVDAISYYNNLEFNLYEYENGVTMGQTPIATNQTGTFIDLPPGVYTVEVIFPDCTTFTEKIFIEEAVCGGGQCDDTAMVGTSITDEQTCDAEDGAIRASFMGSGVVDTFVLSSNGSILETVSTNSDDIIFENLGPGTYTVAVGYTSPDTTTCELESATLMVGEASCGGGGVCGDGTVDPGEDCDDGNTVSGDGCSAICEDEAGGYCGDGTVDSGEECDDGNNTNGDGCSATCQDEDGDGDGDGDGDNGGGGGGGSGQPSSIKTPLCGDGIRDYTEQCDDGNRENGDGCDDRCRLEDNEDDDNDDDEQEAQKTTAKIVHKIKTAIQTIQAACRYDDVNYQNRLSRFNDISWENRYDPSYIMTLYCITQGYNENFNQNAATGIGEAIKMVAKVDAIGENYSFKEVTFVPDPLPYRDMTNYSWYAPYVMYAEEKGLLRDITRSHPNQRNLKALTPISPQQFDLLMQNAGSSVVPYADSNTTEDLFSYLGFMEPNNALSSGQYVTRKKAAEMIISTFPDKFKNYQYVVGNNLQFYEMLIKRIQNRTGIEQVRFVESLIRTLETLDHELIGQELNIDVPIIIDFLEEVLEE